MSAQSTEDQFYEGIGRRVEVTNTSFSVDPYLESLERRGGSVEYNAPLPLELPLCQEFIFRETNMHDIYMHGTIIPINMVLQSLGSKLVFVHKAALAGRPKNPDSQQQSTNLTPDFILARQHDSRPESICDKDNSKTQRNKKEDAIDPAKLDKTTNATKDKRTFSGASLSSDPKDPSPRSSHPSKRSQMTLRQRDQPGLEPSPSISISSKPLGQPMNPSSNDLDSVPIADPQTPGNQNSPDIHSSGGYVPSNKGAFTPETFARYTNNHICRCRVTVVNLTEMKHKIVAIIIGILFYYFEDEMKSP
ncbi:hypothetical protein F4824DRAFT_505258 [Ustulina deusta]|nr:hypothetical protein F4824DRAFT_505258 [Ustulina deusta]